MRMLPSALAVAACLAIIGSVPARAQSLAERAGGTFEKRGDYWQQVKITPMRGGSQFLGAFEVVTRGCTGDVKMRGVAGGPDTILFSKQDDVASGTCRINVKFSRGYDAITVSHEYCSYSGAACDFNGTMRRKAR